MRIKDEGPITKLSRSKCIFFTKIFIDCSRKELFSTVRISQWSRPLKENYCLQYERMLLKWALEVALISVSIFQWRHPWRRTSNKTFPFSIWDGRLNTCVSSQQCVNKGKLIIWATNETCVSFETKGSVCTCK